MNHKTYNNTTGKTLQMKRIAVFMLISVLMIMAGAVYQSTASGEPGPSRGGGEIRYVYHDLVVGAGEEELLQDETIVIAGNIHVEGALVLRNVTLSLNSSFNGEYGINVLPGGDLRILDDSRVGPTGEKHFTFKVARENKAHANLIIADSTITGAGYYSTKPEHTGIFIESMKVTISRSIFVGNHIALNFHHVRGDVLVEETEFLGNEAGIVVESSSGVTLRDNVFQENVRGLSASRSDLLTIIGNTFRANAHGLRMDNSTDFTIHENAFLENELTGFKIESSIDGIVQDNEVTKTRSQQQDMLGSGIVLKANSMVTLSGNSLQHNDIGIMIIFNNTGMVLENTVIRGGKLGLYLYNEHFTNEYSELRITETKEAAMNMKHSSSQIFHDVTLASNQALGLNVTASTATFHLPEFEGQVHFVDEKSKVILSTKTMIRSSELNGATLSGSEVHVIVDDVIVYATEGYGGSDPVTDGMGKTGWITLENIVMDSRGTHPCRIEISVSWKGIELTRTLFGDIETVERFNFKIPDLTVSDNEMVIVPAELREPYEPHDDEVLLIDITITNLGTLDIETDVSIYRAFGSWNGNIHVPVDTFELPYNAALIETIPISVDALETKTVEIGWIPGTAGDHTLIAIIDKDLNSLEIRKDNNIASIQLTVRQSEIKPLEHAVISLEVPGLSNGSEINTTLLNLMPTLRNGGSIPGTVVLMVTLYQHDQTLLFFDGVYSVGAGREIQFQLPVNLELGDAVLNFTLLQQIGEDTLEILTPYLSFSFRVQEGKGPGFDAKNQNEPLIPGVILYSSVAGVVSFFVAYVAFAESARYRLLLFFVPLYMRMSKKDIVEHYTRGEILGYIKQNPGESYNNIKRDLEMSNGKLAYHLSVLEKGSLIKSVTDGMYRRYYPRKMQVTTYGRITSIQEEILRRIEETPGITQKDLSRLVDLSTATINYHVRKLSSKGLIATKRSGIFIHYYLDGLTVEEIMTNAISGSRRATMKQ